MRKQLLISSFVIVSVISMGSLVFAENYTYKVYNPKTKESFPADMITMGISDKTYIIGLSKAMILCEITTVGSKENNLLGGKCIDIKNYQTYNWKEYQPNTFKPELKSIIEERKAEGEKLDDSSYHLLSNDTENKNQSESDNIPPSYWDSYMKKLTRKIKMNWFPPQSDQSKSVVVTIKIAKDGKLLACNVFQPSGIQEVNEEAIKAVKLAAPFEPLPNEYKGQSIDIQFTFDYNVHQLQKNSPGQVTYQEEQRQKEIQQQEQKRASNLGFYSSYADRNKNVSEKVVAIYDKRSPAYGYRYILYSPIGKFVGHHKIMQSSPNGYGFDGIPEGTEGCNENSPVPCFPNVNAAKHYYYPQWY